MSTSTSGEKEPPQKKMKSIAELSDKATKLWVDNDRPGAAEIWRYFLKHTKDSLAKCKKCGAVIKTTGGNTTGIKDHYKLHSGEPSTSAKQQVSNINVLSNYFSTSETFTRDELIAYLCATDGVSFRRLSSSEALRYIFRAKNWTLPRSSNSIRSIVLNQEQTVKNSILSDIAELKANGVKFSLTADEWSSVNKRRYLNLNLHWGTKGEQVFFISVRIDLNQIYSFSIWASSVYGAVTRLRERLS